jgi:DNA-binding response OmpR family regulator
VIAIEPDTALAGTLRSYLTNLDFEVCAVSSAQEAIIESDQRRPDIIVLELAMPGHNGIEFLQEFRSYADWLGIPIIIYSHIPREDTGLSDTAWQKYGVVEYLYKPTTSLERLVHVMRAALEES